MKLRKAHFYSDGAVDAETMTLIESGEYYIVTKEELDEVWNAARGSIENKLNTEGLLPCMETTLRYTLNDWLKEPEQ